MGSLPGANCKQTQTSVHSVPTTFPRRKVPLSSSNYISLYSVSPLPPPSSQSKMLPRPHSSSDALRKLSSRLHSDAGRLATLIPPRSTPVAAVPCVLSLDSLALPDPPSITTSLAKIGVEQQYAERMSTAMTNALLQFKAECQAIFQRRLPLLRVQYQQIQDPKFLATIPLTYLTIYNSAIRNHTSYLLNEVAPRIIRAQQLRHKIKNRGGRVSSGTPFNYVSLQSSVMACTYLYCFTCRARFLS